MKKIFFLLLVVWGCTPVPMPAQQAEDFTIEIEQVTNFNTAPALQSFVFGQYDGKWLLIGGRTDGLHQRQPFASFLASDNNTTIYVVDPVNKQVWSQPLTALANSYQEQLQSTNMNFAQIDTVLYIIGGYGYSATAGDHITYPYLTAVNIPMTIQTVMNSGGNIATGFRQMQDTVFEVTGGQLGYLQDTFYLVGGQKFIGRYNPMGPTHGPGFTQVYTESIRKFQITDNGTTLGFTNFSEIKDAANLHRRDYNLAPQIFPNGDEGFTAFSGVFQHTVDLPWHNTVDITQQGYQIHPNFDQLLSQYHSAKLPIYDSVSNAMHTIFFGGMSRYYFDGNGTLMDDQNVPFVKTISKVTRFANDSMVEYELVEKMPSFLGAGAEFFPLSSSVYHKDKILKLNQLAPGRNLVGYIYGGIESSQENIFFINTGVQSWASNDIFAVYVIIDSTSTNIIQEELNGEVVLSLDVRPNPATDYIHINYNIPYYTSHELFICNADQKVIKKIISHQKGKGDFMQKVNVEDLQAGIYYLVLMTNGYKKVVKFVVK